MAKRAQQIDGIDLTLPFLECVVLLLARPAITFSSQYQALQVGNLLFLSYTNYIINYLGLDTILVSPGAFPVTLAPGYKEYGKSIYHQRYRYVTKLPLQGLISHI